MTYQEFLRSQGASDADISALATPLAIKAFDAQQSALDAANKIAADEKQARIDYNAQVDKWIAEDIQPRVNAADNAVVVAKANEARARAVIEAASKAGLIKVAADLGYDQPVVPAAAAATAGAFDPTKYFTKDDVVKIAEQEGAAIALAQDIAYEHRMLFPDKPLNFRQLREKATASRKSLEQVWQEDFGVVAARTAKAAADTAAYEARLRKEGADEATTRLASQYGNPDARPLVPSVSPFTTRAQGDRTKQPWETSADTLSRDRVQSATARVLEQVNKVN